MKAVKLRFMDKEAECTALFDTGSGVTVVKRAFFEESFGARWLELDQAIKALLGQRRTHRGT